VGSEDTDPPILNLYIILRLIISCTARVLYLHGKRLRYTLNSGLGDHTDGLNSGAHITIFQPLQGNEPQFLGRPARIVGSVPNHAEHCDSVVRQILTVSFLTVISQNLSAVTDYTLSVYNISACCSVVK
jgi:hypothetical protein